LSLSFIKPSVVFYCLGIESKLEDVISKPICNQLSLTSPATVKKQNKTENESRLSNVARRRIRRKQTCLNSGKVAGGKGWHSREIKPKEFKGEGGHIALGVEGHLALRLSSL
jgi:hypothetical protein